ncbi:MAG: membrane protein insertion efficiency factor YidD [Elusimicrobiota bacterium]
MTKFLLFLIAAYQAAASCLGLRPRCRFFPSCSEYAREALLALGPARGVRSAAGRLLRCHPFGGHGFDPAPEPPVR